MAIPSARGRDGTPIPEFGLAARTCRLGWVLESASSEVLDGAGVTGDAIGVDVSQLLAAAGTTRGATRFITGTPSTGAEVCAAEVSTEVEACAAVVSTVSARGPVLSTETLGRLEDSVNPAVKVDFARAPSAASGMADRQGAFHHAECPASGAADFVAAVDFTEAAEDFTEVAGVGNRSFVVFPVDREI